MIFCLFYSYLKNKCSCKSIFRDTMYLCVMRCVVATPSDLLCFLPPLIASKSCPENACFDCPNAPEKGGTSQFKEKAKCAEHIRANHFIESGIADGYRKTADL
jgi:hypothetical protein